MLSTSTHNRLAGLHVLSSIRAPRLFKSSIEASSCACSVRSAVICATEEMDVLHSTFADPYAGQSCETGNTTSPESANSLDNIRETEVRRLILSFAIGLSMQLRDKRLKPIPIVKVSKNAENLA